MSLKPKSKKKKKPEDLTLLKDIVKKTDKTILMEMDHTKTKQYEREHKFDVKEGFRSAQILKIHNKQGGVIGTVGALLTKAKVPVEDQQKFLMELEKNRLSPEGPRKIARPETALKDVNPYKERRHLTDEEREAEHQSRYPGTKTPPRGTGEKYPYPEKKVENEDDLAALRKKLEAALKQFFKEPNDDNKKALGAIIGEYMSAAKSLPEPVKKTFATSILTDGLTLLRLGSDHLMKILVQDDSLITKAQYPQAMSWATDNVSELMGLAYRPREIQVDLSQLSNAEMDKLSWNFLHNLARNVPVVHSQRVTGVPIAKSESVDSVRGRITKELKKKYLDPLANLSKLLDDAIALRKQNPQLSEMEAFNMVSKQAGNAATLQTIMTNLQSIGRMVERLKDRVGKETVHPAETAPRKPDEYPTPKEEPYKEKRDSAFTEKLLAGLKNLKKDSELIKDYYPEVNSILLVLDDMIKFAEETPYGPAFTKGWPLLERRFRKANLEFSRAHVAALESEEAGVQ